MSTLNVHIGKVARVSGTPNYDQNFPTPGFTPKVVWISINENTADGFEPHGVYSLGMFTASEQMTIFGTSLNLGNSVASILHRDHCGGIYNTAGALRARFFFKQMNSGSFDLTHDIGIAGSQIITYCALGGDAIENAEIVPHASPATPTSNVNVTNTGNFQPNFVHSIHTAASVPGSFSGTFSNYGIGQSNLTSQYSSHGYVALAGPSDNVQHNDSFIIMNNNSSVPGRARHTAWLSNGIELDWVAADLARNSDILMIRFASDVTIELWDDTTATSTGPTTISTGTNVPALGMLHGTGTAFATTVSPNGRLFWGLATDSSNQYGQSVDSADSGSTFRDNRLEQDSILIQPEAFNNVIRNRAALTSMGSGVMNVNYDTAWATSTPIWGTAFGKAVISTSAVRNARGSGFWSDRNASATRFFTRGLQGG